MEKRRLSATVLAVSMAALTLLAVGATPAQEAPPEFPRPCEDDPVRGQLDFWVGEWRVVGSEDQLLGHNRISKRHGGCVIEEAWTSGRGGGSGESLNFVDPSDGRWRQVWVGSTGTVIRYEGELRDGAMRFQGSAVTADGTEALSRMVLEPLEGGRVRQRIERSDDDGETWETTFLGTYLPEPGREAAIAPAPAPEPAPAAPPPRQVVAISARAPEDALPPEKRPKTHLQSPMVLEVPVGPVEALPRGYSWSTSETAQYVTEGASIRKVTVSRHGSDLEVTLALYGAGYLQHADLEVELLAGGETVASAGLSDFALGRSLLAQNPDDGLEKRVVLELDRETFERAFGAEERPVLRLVLTAQE